MKTQCCQPPQGGVQCQDCPLTAPLYRCMTQEPTMLTTFGHEPPAMTNAPPLPDEPSRYCGRAMVETFSSATGKPSGDYVKSADYDTLRAQLAEAQREIEQQKRIVVTIHEEYALCRQLLAEQTARADASEKDARRYRWLRVNPVECANLADNQTYRYKKDKPELLDAAIDALAKS